MSRWWIAFLAVLALSANEAQAAPVKTTAGLVEGTVEEGLSVYRGVPFAAPPVGDRRWRPPASTPSW
jgi:para-nitrobenzyl esterase